MPRNSGGVDGALLLDADLPFDVGNLSLQSLQPLHQHPQGVLGGDQLLAGLSFLITAHIQHGL